MLEVFNFESFVFYIFIVKLSLHAESTHVKFKRLDLRPVYS